MAALFDPVTPGIGNLVTEGNRSKDTQRIRRTVFSTVLHLRYARDCNLFSCPPVCEPVDRPPAYLLPQTTLALMCAIMFIGLTRFATDSFRYAFGLFADTGAPVAETVASLTLSTLLGSHYGLDGILLSIVITQTAVIVIWKPYYLISRRMPGFGATYVRLYLSHLAAERHNGRRRRHSPHPHIRRATTDRNRFTLGSWVCHGRRSHNRNHSHHSRAVIMTACFKPFRRFAARIKHHYSTR